ncbi:MAG: DPP IV N-terminal domain-containing protein [Oligoflexales bacterium]
MRIFGLLIIVSIGFGAHAGTDNLSLRDVTTGAKKFSPEKVKQLSWLPGTSKFSFVDPQQSDCLQIRDAVGIKKTKSLCLEEINILMMESGFGHLSSFPPLRWQGGKNFLFWQKQQLLTYDFESGQISLVNTIPENAENIDFRSKNPQKIAYTIDNDLFIADKGVQVQISHAASEEDFTYGKIVHRNEFGISKGTFWSSKSRFLAFYRNDESEVYDFPNIDYEEAPAVHKPFKYPMVGQANEKVRVGIYDIESKKTIYLSTGHKLDQYIAGITFSPDEKRVYLSILNRQQNHLQLVSFDPKDGKKFQLILEESNPKYVEPELGPRFPDNRSDQFIWLSRNNGFRHLFLVNLADGSMDQLTQGEWEVNSFEGFSKCGTKAYFHGRKDSALEQHFYGVDINSKQLTKLTQENGVHHALISSDNNFILDSFETPITPGQIDLLKLKQNKKSKVYAAPNPLAEFKLGETEVITLAKEKDLSLYARMIKPPGFQAEQKYPVLVYVYGGPHVQLVDNSWLNGASLWLHYMAQKGYLVFTIDNRGSYNRGLAFEQASHGELGKVELEDQIYGVDFLKNLPYVDQNRLGVFGWSFGGFMATTLMLKSPEVFKAGVAGGAVIDWSLYEIMYTERYMGTPESNPQGFEASNLLNYVDQLQGKLLMVHGSNDPVVVWQHSLKFAKKAAELGLELDYFPYVGHGHGVQGEEKFHLYQKITAYFDQHLAKSQM